MFRFEPDWRIDQRFKDWRVQLGSERFKLVGT